MSNSESQKVTFISDITIKTLKVCAEDRDVLDAARVSTLGDDVINQLVEAREIEGLVNYLMQHRHGTPFEHNMFRFFVNAPIFVWREWHRHRIGFSYNEESARYTKLKPVFYVPTKERPMFKVDGWKPGRPKFLTIKEEQERINKLENTIDDARYPNKDSALMRFHDLHWNLTATYTMAYKAYEDNLSMGFDPGLARDCLPVGIYSACWVTCNARSLMAFLSLRTHEPEARDVSWPLYEIEVAAREVEKAFKEAMPISYAAFNKFGRRAP